MTDDRNGHLSGERLDAAERRSQPDEIPAMLAMLTEKRFDDPDWIYERKLDGVRCLVYKQRGTVRLMSRNGNRMNDSFPELEEGFETMAADDFIADGEIVTFDDDVTSFQKLQGRLNVGDRKRARNSGIEVFFYLFDLMYIAGYDIRKLPLRDRKSLLKQHLDFTDNIRFTSHRNQHGIDFFNEACGKGWEGVIAKDAQSTYVGSRSKAWLKFKCVNRQEFVIGGFTDPKGARVGFGALLIGYYNDGTLQYAGKVGTGFDNTQLEEMYDRMKRIQRKANPFADVEDKNDYHWTRPSLVAEIGFTEWTSAGRLRHPRFLGLRHDKDPKEVVREQPETS